MDTVTYPTDEVIQEINDLFVPLKSQCNFVKPTELMKKYRVRWTPTLFVLEQDGNPRFHTVGYMPPAELVGQLELIRAMENFDIGQLELAMAELRSVADRYPASAAAPQAIFYEGVARYKQTHEPKHLKRVYVELQKRYPGSLWAKKATPCEEAPD
ncbi:MAG: hypothetical protein C4520_12245 [Candidatus Abyssobacteria bacterium SURF_5]|uniref:Thioredoxin-like fold domain-containing protein n=1 Tax=Abyssobacteria bacterium (strain SURF_5) TaxID=2093360 RepID=A0A3A4NL86_ABYX5|nr:MAG: hypothetical protein C4520_12245 [Candidatus Abyssubacteria bacterium SURF_5]